MGQRRHCLEVEVPLPFLLQSFLLRSLAFAFVLLQFFEIRFHLVHFLCVVVILPGMISCQAFEDRSSRIQRLP